MYALVDAARGVITVTPKELNRWVGAKLNYEIARRKAYQDETAAGPLASATAGVAAAMKPGAIPSSMFTSAPGSANPAASGHGFMTSPLIRPTQLNHQTPNLQEQQRSIRMGNVTPAAGGGQHGAVGGVFGAGDDIGAKIVGLGSHMFSNGHGAAISTPGFSPAASSLAMTPVANGHASGNGTWAPHMPAREHAEGTHQPASFGYGTHATVIANGLTPDRLTHNGLTSVGLTQNGSTSNGLTSNGLTSLGLTSNGLSPNGVTESTSTPHGLKRAVNGDSNGAAEHAPQTLDTLTATNTSQTQQ